MKSLLTTLVVLSVSYSSAQELEQSGVMLQATINDESPFVDRRFAALNEGLVIASQRGVKDANSLFVRFPGREEFEVSGLVEEGVRIDLVRKIPHSKTFFDSVRKEMMSWTGAVPDLSASWLGISCFVRNPLKYMLVPERSFAHELGFRAGDWALSIDGIRSNTLQDLKIALEFPLGKTVSLFVKRSDIYYNLDFHVFGKLPWE